MLLVTIAYFGLLVLVAATPVLLFLDNLVVEGAIQLYAAVSMLIIAVGMRPGEARHFFKLVRVPAALAAIPLLWMLMQLLPIGFGGLSRSIWESAANALEMPRLWASITIDPGLTLIAASRFATMAGIAFVATVVSIDRERAKILLLLLAGAAAVMSLVLLASQLGGFNSHNETSANGTNATMMMAGIVGIVLFAACVIMAIERYERQQEPPRTFLSQPLIPLGVTIAGLIVCSSTLIAGHTSHAIFAAACGLVTVAIVYFVRRLGFGPRAGLAIGCLAIFAASVIIWTKGNPTSGDISLRYMADSNGDAVTLHNRILDAVGLTGSGAGTFPAVSTIYGADRSLGVRPDTFAAQVAIELGRPALWFIVGLACTLIVIFARSAFNRGRDYFYPLAGAGVTVAMVLDCFTSATLTNPAISLLVAVTLGLGFGQSVGRNL
jgi:hypothetical protein